MQLIPGREQQEFHVLHRRCSRIILGISWQDHITNDEFMKRAGIEDLLNIVRVRRLTLAGHILSHFFTLLVSPPMNRV